MTSLKVLAILAVAALVTGCKFSVIVGEGGKVQSSSGTRNCSEGSTCTFQVSDTTFSDTFTAVPLSGYKFARWQGGTDYQCANSTSPTCVVSNTALAGNAAAATIIASDRVFTIKPVFQVITAPRYVVKDGKGEILGDVSDLWDSTAVVILTHNSEGGKQVHYRLQFSNHGVSAYESTTAFWNNSSCTGDDIYVYPGGDAFGMEPFFSKEAVVVETAASPDYDREKSIIDLARVVSDQPQSVQAYSNYDGACRAGGPAGLIPAKIVVRDLRSGFTPPFGLYQE